MSAENRRSKQNRARRELRFAFPRVADRVAAVEAAIDGGADRSQAPAFYLVVMMFVVAVVTSAFVYHLHIRFEGVWLGYETSRARAEKARLLVERRELRLELATLKSPDRVKAEAIEKLGMTMPEHEQIVPIGKTERQRLASGRAR